jgi:hypothetical protein
MSVQRPEEALQGSGGGASPYNSMGIKTQLNSNLAMRDRPHYENDLAEDLRRVAGARVIIDKTVM